MPSHRLTALLVLFALLVLLPGCTPPSSLEYRLRGPSLTLQFEPSLRYQTIEGWGGLIANWHWVDGASGPHVPIPPEILNRVLDDLVLDLGINRVGMGPPRRAVYESEEALRTDAQKIEPYLREILIPLRERVLSRGEPFVFYLIAGFFDPPPGPVRRIIEDPEAYAQFALASLDYMQQRGIAVTYWVMQNEPDYGKPWTPAKLGRFVAYLGARLSQAGYRTKLVVPETVRPSGVNKWLAGIAATPDARQYLGMISYHSYDYDPTMGETPPVIPRAAIANWSRELGLPVAQTEQGQAGKKYAATRWDGMQHEHALDIAQNIFADLSYANASAWQLHAVIGWGTLPDPRIGGTFIAARLDGSGYDKPAHYWAVRHFSHFLRPGAVRVGLRIATPSRSSVLAAGFLSPDGRPVIVAINPSQSPRDVRFSNLPPGAYRLSLTTRDQKAAEQPLGTLAPGQRLDYTLPPESIATIWQP